MEEQKWKRKSKVYMKNLRMKNIIKTIIFLTLISAAAQVSAQEGLDRQIEVTTSYIPDVESARKLDYSPRMIDTVSLKPDVDYTITPTPWNGRFDARPIPAITIDAQEYRPEHPFFLRLAAGVPFQSLLDFYATANTADDVVLGAYLNHYGRWSRIKNDLGVKESAVATRNMAGFYFDKRFARRTLSIKLSDEYRYFENYAGADVDGLRVRSSMYDVWSNDASLSAAFGDDFTDLSRFNYRFGASGNHYYKGHGGYLGIGLSALTGWKIQEGDMTIGLDFNSFRQVNFPVGWGGSAYYDNRFKLSPEYSFAWKDLRLGVGVDLVYDNNNYGGDFYIFPEIKLLYDAFTGFVPYLNVTGELGDGSIKALQNRHPFVNTDYVKTPLHYGLELGAYGSLGRAVSYNVNLGCKLYSNYTYMVDAIQYTGTSSAPTSDYYEIQAVWNDKATNIFFAGIDLKFILAKGLSLDAGFRYNYVSEGRSGNANLPASGIPAVEMSAALKYNYREKLFLSLGMELLGKRTFTTEVSAYASAGANPAVFIYQDEYPATVNLRLEAEYRINPRLSVFLWGDNLLNQRIYPLARYPQLGINVLGGIKLLF